MGEQQSAAMPVLNDGDCYGFERKSAGDFPFYRQSPNALSGRSWMLILLGVVLGFAVLTAHIGFYKTTAGGFVPAILFLSSPWPCSPWWWGRHGDRCFERRRGEMSS